eukprot:c25252_g1_i8 orf=423-812(+)
MRHDDVDDDDAVADKVSAGSQSEEQEPAYSGLISCLHKAHLRLHKLMRCMHAVSIMFDTLKLLVEGTRNQTLNPQFIESVRNEPLMLENLAEQIRECHTSLSKHLDDLREQVLICFCFINSARDWICST